MHSRGSKRAFDPTPAAMSVNSLRLKGSRLITRKNGQNLAWEGERGRGRIVNASRTEPGAARSVWCPTDPSQVRQHCTQHRPPVVGQGECSSGVAKLGVSHHQVRKLIKAGILTSQQIIPDAPHQIRAADLSSEQVATALKRKGRPCRLNSEKQILLFSDT